jgi:glycerol-3-phosphate acyltransferase PlsX
MEGSPGFQGPGASLPQGVVIAVDANGADLGAAEVAAGAVLAAEEGARVLLFGPAGEMEIPPACSAAVQVVDAPLSIAKSVDPAKAARATPEASIVQAARSVAGGRAQALVCAGGTGAAVAAGLFNIRRARGIHRPALALALPVPGRPVVLLDVGANAQARREHLVQFAFMGAALAQAVLGVRRPRVALLSNGEEAERGSPVVVQAGAELAELVATEGGLRDGGGGAGYGEGMGYVGGAADGGFELIGNVEGGDIVGGTADVIVTDGFTGNIALKLMEGVSQTMLRGIRDAAMSSPRAKLGGMLLRPALRGFRDDIDPEAHGGAYLLGLRSLGVVPHGRFTRRGFAQAILLAQRGVREDVVGRTYAALEQAGALKTSPLSAHATAPVSARASSLREDP